MTKFMTTLMLLVAMSLPTIAQQTTTRKAADRGANIEDVEKMADARLEIETRAQAIKFLGLTEEEIIDFTPIFIEYNQAKDQLQERRSQLVKEFADEMAEDNSVKSEKNETADFIENYWELDIAAMELRKDMFDRFEDEIGPQRALDFFAMEEMLTSRAKRKLVTEMLPTVRLYVPVVVSYQPEVDAFRNWNRINIEGNVSVDHNFTYNGLSTLLTAAEKMAMTEGINVNNFTSRKQMIMSKAAQMKENWKSLKHADLAREAFTATADLLGEIANDNRFVTRDAWVSKLRNTAKKIESNKQLTSQSAHVYSFFTTAETIVNDLVDQANAVK